MSCIHLHSTNFRIIMNSITLFKRFFDSSTSISSNSNRLPSQGSYCYLVQSRQSLLNKLDAAELKNMKGTATCS